MYGYFEGWHEGRGGLYGGKVSKMMDELHPLARPDVGCDDEQQAPLVSQPSIPSMPIPSAPTWTQWFGHQLWFVVQTVFDMTDLYIHGMHEGLSGGMHDEIQHEE